MTSTGFLIATGLVGLGLTPDPRDWLLLQDGQRGWLWLLIGGLQLSGLLPFSLVLLTALGIRIPPTLALVFACLIVPTGIILSLIAGATAGAGREMMFLQGCLITMAVAGALLWMAYDNVEQVSLVVAGVAVLIPALAGVFSLGTAGVVLISAHRIAAGAPYCLAQGGRAAGAVASIWDYRWFSFYTTASGYKESSRSFFHGLLVVDTLQGRQVYNWSPRRMRFHPVKTPARLVVEPRRACEPSRETAS